MHERWREEKRNETAKSSQKGPTTAAPSDPKDARVRNRIIRLLAVTMLLVLGLTTAGASAEGELVASDRAFYLRGEGCGATAVLYLSYRNGADGYDGCGSVGGVPFQELIHQVDGPRPKTFSTRGEKDGVPVTLDGTRDITGQIRGESWFSGLLPVPGVGQVVVDVTVYGIDSANKVVTLGSATEEAINTGHEGVQVPFTIDIDDALSGVELKSLSIDLELHGANYNSGNIGLEGDSNFNLPILLPAPTPTA